MTAIRPYRADDLNALYSICLATSDAGADGSRLYRDPNLVGHVYAAPYAVLAPEAAFVLEDDQGIGGYIVGTPDTHAFEARAEDEWWPRLRAIYSDPRAVSSPDDRMAHLIHHPEVTKHRLYTAFPAHLHVNVLPRLQEQGHGTRLMDTWLAAIAKLGVRRAHLGVGVRNAGAVAFYRRYGFREIERENHGSVIIFGIETGGRAA
jgi:ribosomal protein S18 acetylase RimI-like enzyme